MVQLTIAAIIRIAEQHLRVLHEKHGVRHIGVPARHAALHDDDMLALPRVQHGHAGDGAPGLQRDRVHCVVGADDERHVGFVEVVVDLVHLEHDVVAHARFLIARVSYLYISCN